MDRKEFLGLVGQGAASAFFMGCLAACSKGSITSPTSNKNVDFTLDLTSSQYKSLQTNGGYIYKEGIIVAKTINGDYVAVSAICTHAGTYVQYTASNNSFYCPSHGSDFTTSGSVINGPAYIPLKQYKTALSGNSLRVYS